MKLQLPQFSTNKELFAYLMANKSQLIDMKKSATKTADCWATPAAEKTVQIVGKAAAENKDTADTIHRTVIPNTYLWMDSHDDVHIPGIFSKAISEKTPWHLHDHLFQITAKVGVPQKVYERFINWRDLGVDKDGQTVSLFADTRIERKLNSQVFDAYKDNEINQHSVGMIYVRLALAMNDEDYKEAFALWNTYLPQLGNPERAEAKGYFWAVQEAKLPEFSCVLEGSNSLTPTIDATDKGTANAPEQSTQEQPRKSMFASIGDKINN